jgi:hypothetical protein
MRRLPQASASASPYKIKGEAMRKLRIVEHISLDGVIQAAGGKEDGYPYGGWAAPYDDPDLGKSHRRGFQPASRSAAGPPHLR